MNDVAKGMFLVLAILYVLSPVDACPGPVDDLLVLLVALAATKNTQVAGE